MANESFAKRAFIVLTDPLYSLIAFVQFERRILKQFAKRGTFFNEVD